MSKVAERLISEYLGEKMDPKDLKKLVSNVRSLWVVFKKSVPIKFATDVDSYKSTATIQARQAIMGGSRIWKKVLPNFAKQVTKKIPGAKVSATKTGITIRV